MLRIFYEKSSCIRKNVRVRDWINKIREEICRILDMMTGLIRIYWMNVMY